MSITTYTELQTAIASWLHRTDLTAQIPDFITLAETRIRALLRARLQDAVVPLSTVAGVEYLVLPSTLLHVRSLSIPSVQPTIDYMAPDMFNEEFDPGISGTPRCYTIIGELLYLGPTPDAVYAINAVASSEFPALTTVAPSNTLIARWPNVYLFGSLKEAAEYAMDIQMAERYNGFFMAAMNDVNNLDWNTPGTLAVRTDVRHA